MESLERSHGCDVCRSEIEAFTKPHLTNVFATTVPGGDLSGLARRVIEQPIEISEEQGRVGYQNDFVYRCSECQALWLQQYWEVDTPETAHSEFGHRYTRVLSLSPDHLALIETAIESGRKLPHDAFTRS